MMFHELFFDSVVIHVLGKPGVGVVVGIGVTISTTGVIVVPVTIVGTIITPVAIVPVTGAVPH